MEKGRSEVSDNHFISRIAPVGGELADYVSAIRFTNSIHDQGTLEDDREIQIANYYVIAVKRTATEVTGTLRHQHWPNAHLISIQSWKWQTVPCLASISGTN